MTDRDPVHERFNALLDLDDDSDWSEVRRRARGRRRIVVALGAAAAALVALFVVPGIGLGGRIVGLFTGPGKPVPLAQLAENDRRLLVLAFCSRVELVTPKGRAPETRCAAGAAPNVTQIANDGERAYWKIVFPDGHVCVASGSTEIRRNRVFGDSQFGSMGCSEGEAADWLVPSPEHPLTSEVAMGGSRSEDVRILSVSGLAGDGVASVGLADGAGESITTEVKGNVYALNDLPTRDWVTLVAYDEDGQEVYRESLLNPPRRSFSRVHERRQPPAGSPRKLVQHAEVDGAAIDVYASGRVVVEFTSQSEPYAFLPGHLRGGDKVTVECGRIAFGAGRWLAESSGLYEYLARKIETTIPAVGSGIVPPFDVCSVRGHYGRRWDEHVGYHNAVEFPFNSLAERFFAEQAAARRVAYFVRSPKMREIRRALKAGGMAPPSREIASRFDESVVALADAKETPPPGKVGVWSDGKAVIVASERADDGRRMYVTLQNGRIGSHNLHSLALVF